MEKSYDFESLDVVFSNCTSRVKAETPWTSHVRYARYERFCILFTGTWIAMTAQEHYITVYT